MTYKENIRVILECYFTGFKDEIIESACNRILEQSEELSAENDDLRDQLAMRDRFRKYELSDDAYRLGYATAQNEKSKQNQGYWICHECNGVDYIECSGCSVWFKRDHLIHNSYCPNCGLQIGK